MPTSCSDLQRMGHKLSGFFSVKGSQKLEMVYCTFTLIKMVVCILVYMVINLLIIFIQQTKRNGSDKPTWNQHPSISSSNGKTASGQSSPLNIQSTIQHWTRKQAIKFGWWLLTGHLGSISGTSQVTTLISSNCRVTLNFVFTNHLNDTNSTVYANSNDEIKNNDK